MKLYLLLSLIYIITSSASFGADWDLINPKAKAYYTAGDSAFHVVDIRREIKVENGMEYENFYANEITTGPVNRPNCVIADGAGWLGRTVFFGTDKSQFFTNKDDETILFYPNAGLGVSWKLMDLDFGNYVQATVKETGASQLFTTTDSVKKIELQVFNNKNEAVNSTLNGRFFTLSKNHGLTEMYNIFHFPDSLGRYRLRGIDDGALKGIQPILYKDAFDFDVGDEFHIYEGDTNGNNVGTLVYRRIIVQNKSFFESENTFDYEVEQKVMQIRFDNDNFDTLYNDNFVHIRIDLNNYQNYTPEISYFTDVNNRDSSLTSNMIFVGQYDGRQVIRPWIKYDYFRYPCYAYSSNSWTARYSYIEGCGEFYEDIEYFISRWKRLVYYKKADTEWGKRLDFVVGVNEHNEDKEVKIEEYLNNSILKIHAGEHAELQMKIYNVNGQLVLTDMIQLSRGLNYIPASNLPLGIYLITLSNGSKFYTDRIIVNE